MLSDDGIPTVQTDSQALSILGNLFTSENPAIPASLYCPATFQLSHFLTRNIISISFGRLHPGLCSAQIPWSLPLPLLPPVESPSSSTFSFMSVPPRDLHYPTAPWLAHLPAPCNVRMVTLPTLLASPVCCLSPHEIVNRLQKRDAAWFSTESSKPSTEQD